MLDPSFPITSDEGGAPEQEPIAPLADNRNIASVNHFLAILILEERTSQTPQRPGSVRRTDIDSLQSIRSVSPVCVLIDE